MAHAIVDLVEAHAHVSGRGRRSFTATEIRVTVVAPTRDARERYEAVFDGAMPLADRILERLESLDCGVDDLTVAVSYAAQARPGWVAPDFHVVFHRAESARARLAVDEGPGPVIELRVTHGAAEQPAYFCSQARVDIGRCRDVRDTRHRLVRTNHVVFVDSAEPANQSVSRQHAHIASEGAGRRARLRRRQHPRHVRGAVRPDHPGSAGVARGAPAQRRRDPARRRAAGSRASLTRASWLTDADGRETTRSSEVVVTGSF